MAGTVDGGRKAAQQNILREPGFYSRIGAMGGKKGTTGGFAAYVPCNCLIVEGTHKKAQCAGKKGGFKSRRGSK